jgi:hypothetical protein
MSCREQWRQHNPAEAEKLEKVLQTSISALEDVFFASGQTDDDERDLQTGIRNLNQDFFVKTIIPFVREQRYKTWCCREPKPCVEDTVKDTDEPKIAKAMPRRKSWRACTRPMWCEEPKDPEEREINQEPKINKETEINEELRSMRKRAPE